MTAKFQRVPKYEVTKAGTFRSLNGDRQSGKVLHYSQEKILALGEIERLAKSVYLHKDSGFRTWLHIKSGDAWRGIQYSGIVWC